MAVYNSNVRSILEYCSVIWGGAARCHLVRVERVQHKFLMWLANNTEPASPSLDYAQLLTFYGVQPLQARRQQCDVLFLCKIFRGLVDSSHLLESFTFHVSPRFTRGSRTTLFHIPSCRVNAVASGIFSRIPRLVNRFLEKSPQSDLLCDPLGRLKKHVAAFTASEPTVS